MDIEIIKEITKIYVAKKNKIKMNHASLNIVEAIFNIQDKKEERKRKEVFKQE